MSANYKSSYKIKSLKHTIMVVSKQNLPEVDNYYQKEFSTSEHLLASDQNRSKKKWRSYGWLNFRPKCLQCFNKPIYFLICLCAVVFGQGLVCTGISNTVITSVEKRYGFKTTHIGLFKTCFHIAAGLFNAVICYFGHRHRPLTIAMGCLLISLGNFIATISHYISPPYKAGVTLLTDTCRISGNVTVTSDSCLETGPQSRHLAIFIISQCIIGLGVTPLYSLGYAHLDEITSHSNSKTYISVMGAVAAVGPAAGFMLANPLLKIFVDIKQVIACSS